MLTAGSLDDRLLEHHVAERVSSLVPFEEFLEGLEGTVERPRVSVNVFNQLINPSFARFLFRRQPVVVLECVLFAGLIHRGVEGKEPVQIHTM